MFETGGEIDLDDDFLCISFPPLRQETHENNLTNTLTVQKPKEEFTFCCSQSLGEPGGFEPSQRPISTDQYRTTNILNVSNKSPIKKVVKRKFPGPAGLLPDERSGLVNLDPLDFKRVKDANDFDTDEILCSQKTASIYEGGPWMEMAREFKPSKPSEIFLPDKYNIRWIKSNAHLKRFINQKVPFLAAVIESINANSTLTSINLTLKDMTGEIDAAIVHNLYNDYADDLTIGSVIVLKHTGVFTTENNRHYLTITNNNLVMIYSRNTQSKMKDNLNNLSDEAHSSKGSNESVKKVVLHRISSAELLEQVNNYSSPNSHGMSVSRLATTSSDRLEKVKNNFTISEQPKLAYEYEVSSTTESQIPVEDQMTHSVNSQLENCLNSLIDDVNFNSITAVKDHMKDTNQMKSQNIFAASDDLDFSFDDGSCDIDMFMGSLEVPNIDLDQKNNENMEHKSSSSMNSFVGSSKISNIDELDKENKVGRFKFKQKNCIEMKINEEPKIDKQSRRFRELGEDNLKNVLDLPFEEEFHLDSQMLAGSKSSGLAKRNNDSKGIETPAKQEDLFLKCSQLWKNTDTCENNTATENRTEDKTSCYEQDGNTGTKANKKNELKKFRFKSKNCDVYSDVNNSEGCVKSAEDKTLNEQYVNNAKESNIIIGSSQLSVTTTNAEHNQIWENVLDDIDTDSLFEDF